MRCCWLLATSLLACASEQGPPPGAGTPDASDLKAAWQAYSAYCSLCRNGGPCCLREADFAPERWSKQSGPYLRAMRDYYECEFAESSTNEYLGLNAPARPADQFPTISNYARNCEPHACQGHSAKMASELDRALAQPRAHSANAVVACAP
jgi:hypothetical protein